MQSRGKRLWAQVSHRDDLSGAAIPLGGLVRNLRALFKVVRATVSMSMCTHPPLHSRLCLCGLCVRLHISTPVRPGHLHPCPPVSVLQPLPPYVSLSLSLYHLYLYLNRRHPCPPTAVSLCNLYVRISAGISVYTISVFLFNHPHLYHTPIYNTSAYGST